ncbi:putative sulfate transporter [compost metagenome]
MPGLLIYRFDAPLLFFNADYFKQRLLHLVEQADQPRAVLLNAETMINLDLTGLATLREVKQTLAAQGVHFGFARLLGPAYDLLQRSGELGELKPPLVFSSVRAGINAYQIWLAKQGDRDLQAPDPVA